MKRLFWSGLVPSVTATANTNPQQETRGKLREGFGKVSAPLIVECFELFDGTVLMRKQFLLKW